MTEFLSKELREEMRAAALRAGRKRRHRLTLHVGQASYPILRLFQSGFEVETETTPPLRGLVDIFDGPRHLAQALIVATCEGDGVKRYEFKLNPQARDHAPLDFERAAEAELFLPPGT